MDHLIIHQQPSQEKPILIAAMAGWPDAQSGGTGAIKYLIRKLSAEKFAEVDPEEFYVFTRRRPIVRLDPQGQRVLRWPTNAFYHCPGEGASPHKLAFFVGMEPQLKWKTFAATVMEVARQCHTQRLFFLGSLLDAVPHTRQSPLSGYATDPQLQAMLQEMGVRLTRYEGPTGAASVLMEACRRESVGFASFFAHCPHYLQGSPNPQASLSLLKYLASLVDLDVDLAELGDAAIAFESQVNRAVANNQELATYIRRLEEGYDQAQGSPPPGPFKELPSSDVVIQDLEDFLRTQQPPRGPQGGEGDAEDREEPGLDP